MRKELSGTVWCEKCEPTWRAAVGEVQNNKSGVAFGASASGSIHLDFGWDWGQTHLGGGGMAHAIIGNLKNNKEISDIWRKVNEGRFFHKITHHIGFWFWVSYQSIFREEWPKQANLKYTYVNNKGDYWLGRWQLTSARKSIEMGYV